MDRSRECLSRVRTSLLTDKQANKQRIANFDKNNSYKMLGGGGGPSVMTIIANHYFESLIKDMVSKTVHYNLTTIKNFLLFFF